jgi:hypothetical protein
MRNCCRLGKRGIATMGCLLVALGVLGVPTSGQGKRSPGPKNDQLQFISLPLPADLLASLVTAESQAADPAVLQIGPIPSSSPDSGTCGNDWATDTFTRNFQVKQNGDGTYRVYESFKDGSFVTIAGPSPGACDSTDGTPPGLVNAGVQGNMHGYLLTNVACDPIAGCPANPTCGANNALCQTTNDFIAAFFGAGASRNDQAYFFHYTGFDGSNKALVEHEWKNASTNRGGNHGDIASCYGTLPAAVVPLAFCSPADCPPPPPVGVCP